MRVLLVVVVGLFFFLPSFLPSFFASFVAGRLRSLRGWKY